MRNALIALTLLVATPHIADAKPRKQSAKALARNRAILECVDERTGPTGGLELDDAEKLCRTIARHDAKVAKLAKRAAEARSAGLERLVKRIESECVDEVTLACEDTTERAEDHGECSAARLEAKHAFDVCRGKAPAKR
jgi:hypothetical protein